jgi:hypothetical protein
LLLAGNSGGLEAISLYRNLSSASNTVPGPPTNLAVTTFGPNATLTWSAATDGQTPSAGLNYNLRVGTAPGAADVVNPQADSGGYRGVVALGNAGQNLSAVVRQLKPGMNYYWSVQAVDAAFAGGTFAAEDRFTMPVPAAPTLLSLQVATNSVQLSAVGTPGWNYGIQAAAELTTNAPTWLRLGERTADGSGHIGFLDTTPGLPGRFYRAVYP